MIGWLRLVFVLACVALVSLVLVPLQMLAMSTGVIGENRVRGLWHRIVIWALGFRIHRSGSLSEKRPLLIASNHVSWTDIEVIASQENISFIAKAELADWPVLGRLTRFQRPILVQRERKQKSGEQVNEIAKRLQAGDAIVLFPEGTTGDGNALMPFKSSLFGAAAMALSEGGAESVYIQPVAIAYTRLQGLPMGRQHRGIAAWIGDLDFAPHLFKLLRQGAIDVELHFGEPLEFTATSDRKEAARDMQARVGVMLQEALRQPVGGR